MFMTHFSTYLLLLVLCIGPGAATVHAEAKDEPAVLRAQEQRLSKKVRALRFEQQQLLLRKMLYSADSKYLELDLRSGEGSLRYRTRILRTFRFTRQGKYPKPMPEGGIFAMSAKNDGAPSKRRLSFHAAAVPSLTAAGEDTPSAAGGSGSRSSPDATRPGAQAALVLEGMTARKGHGSSCTGLCLSLGRKDLAAIFFALENGSFAYVKLP